MKMAPRTERNFKKFAKSSLEQILSDYEREKTERAKLEQRESIATKSSNEQRKCVQPLHPLEKNLAKKTGEELEQAKKELIEGLDIASAKSFARIIAEIKQLCLNATKVIEVDLSIDEFYNDFENACARELEGLQVSEEEFKHITHIYEIINFVRIGNLSKKLNYNRAVDQIEVNFETLKNCAIVENVAEV